MGILEESEKKLPFMLCMKKLGYLMSREVACKKWKPYIITRQGLQVNFRKSKVWFSPVASKLNITTTKDLGCNLGVPLLHSTGRGRKGVVGIVIALDIY
ncbi:hypothetical protein K2173_019825 [Erythroxylum novogranatense]|uniref:Uncharacterized protein n=1 Tax=Erythroxylum novogranatense TaxID=1862640 RepID=A0AAV8SMA1_9ROSI|nr:hypothetical protein K2173_019825 [Erythroxylum novogranatense]